MSKYGKRSIGFLNTCCSALQLVFLQVVKRFDNSILDGARTPAEQKQKVDSGASKTLNSKHIPRKANGDYDPKGKSRAIDSAPYPIKWPDEAIMNQILSMLDVVEKNKLKIYIKTVGRFYAYAGYVKGTADAMGVPLRGGFDWDGDWDLTDQTFDDLVHFEIKED